MSSLASSSRIVLSRDHLIAMLSQPTFFDAVPAFSPLQPATLDAVAAAQRHRKHPNRRSCCGADWKFFRGVLDAFFLRLRSLAAPGPAHDAVTVTQLKQFIGACRNTAPPEKLVIMYRRSKMETEIAKLVI
jgi:hypothetical protein